MRSTHILSLIGVLICLGACAPAAEEVEIESVPAASQVLKLEELTFPEIDKLDREKTIFFLTFGILEEHGPHIPVGADYFQSVGIRDRLIERLQAVHPDFDFVVMPVVPLGEGGANDLAWQFDHVGTFSVRFSTLRDVAIDLGASIARKGFQNIFLIHSHGSPLHNVAYNEAAGFVSERYSVRMVNISSLVFGEGFYSDEVLDKHLGKGWQEEIGITGHAGTGETSVNLFLHELVKPEYKDLEPFVVRDFAEIFRINEREGWQGYWSDPSKATREIGQELINDYVERSFRIAEKALAGDDLSELPVYPMNLPEIPEAEELLEKLLEIYANQKAEIDTWLKEQQPAR